MSTNKITRIKLDATPASSLNWENEKSFAESAKSILWHFDMGLFSTPLSNQQNFLTLQLALDHFTKNLYPLYQSKTVGCVMYEGTADIPQVMKWDEAVESKEKEWLLEIANEQNDLYGVSDVEEHPIHFKRLFAKQVLADYLDLLLVALPPDVQSLLNLDMTAIETLETQLALSRDLGNQHTEKNLDSEISFEVNKALLLPTKNSLLFSHWTQLVEFQQKHPDIKLIPEEKLNEEWQGLDELYFIDKTLSPMGRRFVAGFEAACGILHPL
ncbi:MAG: hypothetical protein JHC93_05035 [Parachlamydiales bacterium]|nr:hypothetical protein [Parachlamydiales bacterium]